MATLFLVRHGLTAQTGKVLYGQRPGIDLDDRGRAQAARLAERFAPVKLTALYSSPLERCTQTVEPLAGTQGLPIRPAPGLIEMDAGSWTGRTLTQLRRTKLWRTVQEEPSAFRFPDGEAFVDAQRRAVATIERIARAHRRGRVAVATHGDIVRIVLAHFAGAPLDEFQRIVVDAASVSVVGIDRGRARLLLVNDTGGLDRFGAAPVAPWEAVTGNGARTKVRG
ncbi:MAG TPA: MSMEG_4193 family putative phosphomutase [Actinomycetota bacterium]|nr:MSMEG_4193 family putative phosphomutase [Actinomycetota bacterium]